MATKPIKVSQLNGYIKRILSMDPILGNVTVQGEISNLKFHGSGHVYFTLKDETSRINCFLSHDNLSYVHFQLTEGMQVILTGYINVYERGGSYSINVRTIEADGAGSLSIAFEELKKKLSEKGYFDQDRKRKIPLFPDKVAVITSDTGAAIEDILRVIKLRNSYVDILVVPCLVQGPSAARDIADAIYNVNEQAADVDVIITGRGGGSMEELWAFNEEITADAIYNSRIPVISAVGHETDFTISDFVADLRAQTPTEAAALAVPDIEELKRYLEEKKISFSMDMDKIVSSYEMKLKSTDLDILTGIIERRIESETYAVSNISMEMERHLAEMMHKLSARVELCGQRIEQLNPMSVLKRGYAAVTAEDGEYIRNVEDIKVHDRLNIYIEGGHVLADVSEVWRDK